MEQDKSQQLDQAAEQLKAAKAAHTKKIVIWSSIGVAAVAIIIGSIFATRYFGTQKQAEAIGMADIEQNDSIQAAMYKKIADDGSYKANERAQLMTAIKLYNDSNYKECLSYLDKPSVSSDIIATGIKCLKGDCNVNLNQLDEAIKCYKDALDEADNNPVTTPFVLNKLAQIYHHQKNYTEELNCYEQIRRDYPSFMSDIEKYYQRAKALAGK